MRQDHNIWLILVHSDGELGAWEGWPNELSIFVVIIVVGHFTIQRRLVTLSAVNAGSQADVKCLHWCQRYSTVQHPITWLAYSNHNTSVVKWLRCKNQEKSVLTVYLHVIYDYSWFGIGISFLRLDMPNFQKNRGSFGNFWEILNHYIWNI